MGRRTDGRAEPNLLESCACTGVQLITKCQKNCFYTKTQVWVKINVYYKSNIMMKNLLTEILLGAVFGRLAISSVYKLLAQINFNKSFDGKLSNRRRF